MPRPPRVDFPDAVYHVTCRGNGRAVFFWNDKELARHGRGVGAAKTVAVELACRLKDLSQRAIGMHYGGIGSAAVSTIHRKVWEGRHDMAASQAAELRKLNFKV